MQNQSICIILPTRNEELGIGKVIDEIPREALEKQGYLVNILVVDGGSTDDTRQIALEKGAKVIVEPKRGKGRQMRLALDSDNSDFVFMLDADFTYPAIHILDMLEHLHKGFPVVIGSRLNGQREAGAMKQVNVIGNRLLTILANCLYRTRISDVCTGYWGVKGGIIRNLRLSAVGFEFEVDLFSKLAKAGYDIAEIPIFYRKRSDEAKLSWIVDGIIIGWVLVTSRFRR